MNSQPTRYTLMAIVFHWATAVLVFILFPLGWYMVDLPKGPERSANFALHKSIGLTVLSLMVVRYLWRLMHQPPPLPGTMPAWQRSLAEGVHRGFYVFLFLQPISGYLSSSFSGHATRLFGIPLPQWGWPDQVLNQFFTDIHVLSSFCFLGLIIAHVVGAMSHLLKKGDQTIQRILPPFVQKRPAESGRGLARISVEEGQA